MISQLSLALLVAQTQTQAPAQAPFTVTPKKVLQGLRALAFATSPTGSKFAATMEDRTVRIIDASTNQTIKVLEGHPVPAYAIAWSRDGAYIATGDESARIFIWDTRTWKRVKEMRTHIRGIQALSFNSPRTMLISTGKDDVVKVYDVASSKELHSILGKGSNFYSATFIDKTNDFGVGILGYGGRIYNAGTGQVQKLLTGHGDQGVFDIDFNAAGTRAVTAGRDANAAIWDVKGAIRLNYLKGHTDWVVHSKFTPSGKYVATSSSDRTVRFYNAANFQASGVLEEQTSVGSPLCFTADGKYLITVSLDDYIQINSVNPPQPGVAEKFVPVKTKPKPKPKKKKK